MLYCAGDCGFSWSDGVPNCQKLDADDYCKLKNCDANAFAGSFDVTAASNSPGFACGNYRIGQNFGNWFGLINVHFDDSILSSHGGGQTRNVVSNVICNTQGKSYLVSLRCIYTFTIYFISDCTNNDFK